MAQLAGGHNPLLARRGGRENKKMPRSLLLGAAGVVAFEPSFGMHSWNMVCERRLFMFRAIALTPRARLRRIRWLRDIFFTAQTPSSRGGD
jgi:hypothetical protein